MLDQIPDGWDEEEYGNEDEDDVNHDSIHIDENQVVLARIDGDDESLFWAVGEDSVMIELNMDTLQGKIFALSAFQNDITSKIHAMNQIMDDLADQFEKEIGVD